MIITSLKVVGYLILGSIVIEIVIALIAAIGVLISNFFGGDKWKNQI